MAVNWSAGNVTPCAWCLRPDPDLAWHGAPFHAACWTRREAMLRPGPAALADFVVDELGGPPWDRGGST